MRARIFLVIGAISLNAVAFVLQACGETEPAAVSNSTADSGADVVDSGSAKPDSASSPADDDAATCDLSADFSTKIPDASIADGASTSGLCLGCAKANCNAEVTACNQDCPCQELASSALDCYLKNTANPILCAGNFTGVDTNTQQLGFAIISCLQDECKAECATESFVGDAGKDADAN
jgi:hypothetical protein